VYIYTQGGNNIRGEKGLIASKVIMYICNTIYSHVHKVESEKGHFFTSKTCQAVLHMKYVCMLEPTSDWRLEKIQFPRKQFPLASFSIFILRSRPKTSSQSHTHKQIGFA